ncbi:MAG: hypothetical protein WCF99_00315 [Chloroflexales bacterium]
MATDTTRTAPDDEPLTAADRAAIARALAEPGIAITADELAALIAAGGDDEVRDLLAAGQVAEAIGVARFNIAEATYNWDEPRNRPLPHDDEPFA